MEYAAVTFVVWKKRRDAGLTTACIMMRAPRYIVTVPPAGESKVFEAGCAPSCRKLVDETLRSTGRTAIRSSVDSVRL